MNGPGRNDELDQQRQQAFERLFISAREDERRRKRRAAVAWVVAGAILVGFWVLDVAVGWPGLLMPRRISKRWSSATLALAAFGGLIVFPDRAADWLRDRFHVRHDIALWLSLGTGITGFAATWWLGVESGVITWQWLPPIVLVALYIVRCFLASLDRTIG